MSGALDVLVIGSKFRFTRRTWDGVDTEEIRCEVIDTHEDGVAVWVDDRTVEFIWAESLTPGSWMIESTTHGRVAVCKCNGHHGPGWYSWDTSDNGGTYFFGIEPTISDLADVWGDAATRCAG